MPKVKLTITESRCRSGYFEKGQVFIVEDLCPHYATNYGTTSILRFIARTNKSSPPVYCLYSGIRI